MDFTITPDSMPVKVDEPVSAAFFYQIEIFPVVNNIIRNKMSYFI